MKTKLLCASLLTASLLSAPAMANDVLTGTTKLACEAILCLSSPTRPAECIPSIRKYLSIWHTKPHKTIAARRSFLQLCPTASDATVRNTIEDIVNKNIPDCTAKGLNKAYAIKNRLTAGYTETQIYLNPESLEQRCGKEWQSWVQYKCDKKQVIDYDASAQNGVIGIVGLKDKIKTKTINTNCRFEDVKY